MMSNYEDMSSDSLQFTSKRYAGFFEINDDEQYFFPEQMKNETLYHNELNLNRRNKKGEKIQPDYIVAFKKDGQVLRNNYITKAQKDFGNIPIALIDVDKCLLNEEIKTLQMIKRYQKTGDKSLIEDINAQIQKNNNTENTYAIQPYNKNEKIKDFRPIFEDKILEDVYGRYQDKRRFDENYLKYTEKSQGKKVNRTTYMLNSRWSINTERLEEVIQQKEEELAMMQENTRYEKETPISKAKSVLGKIRNLFGVQDYKDIYEMSKGKEEKKNRWISEVKKELAETYIEKEGTNEHGDK